MAMSPSLYGLNSAAYGQRPKVAATSYEPNVPYMQPNVAAPTAEGLGLDGSMSNSVSASMAGLHPDKVSSGYHAQTFAPVAPIDTTAQHAAAFAQAKDEAAQTARASLTGLSSELGARGMKGGGYEGGQIGQTLGREANTIGQASRAESQSQFDAAQRNAELNANMQMAQRAQDIGWQENLLGNDVAQRGQDVNAGATDYQGQIAQRGQDYGQRASLNALKASLGSSGYQGQIAQRGQDYGQANDLQDLVGETDRANLGGMISQRGQDMADETGKQNRQLSREQMAQQLQLAMMRGGRF